MAGKTSLWVPIRIDGLYVASEGQNFGPPMADFSQLPYYLFDGSTQHADRPNLAEFAFNQSASISFPKGLHVHWALPDALTTGRHRDGSTVFPAVPNRWLVRRLDDRGTLQKSTIVESDFLHPCDDNGEPTYQKPPAGSAAWPPVTFPTKSRQLAEDKLGAAFRYMGRRLSLEEWSKPGAGDEYLNQRDDHSEYRFSQYPLTALGYGQPAFAAYYPNCYSVFGFCDVDPDLQEGSSYEYEVIGWFNELDLDPLQSAEFARLPNDAARYEALEREYRWSLKKADTNSAFPTLTVCYGSLTLTPNKVPPWCQPDNSNFSIAIGNTGGEALAALLADEVATSQQPTDKVLIEDQLEALNVAAALQGVEVDYKAHFAQTRHQRGFRGLAGGSRWSVLPKQPQPVSAADAEQDAAPQPPLPDVVAHALDALNTAQEAYNMARQEIVELRYQTFCDWYKFLYACYGDGPGLGPFKAQKTDLGPFIQQQALALLNNKIGQAGTLHLTKDTATAEGAGGSAVATLALSSNTLTPAQLANYTLAVQVLLRLKALVDSLKAVKLTDKFEIANLPAEHFWQPREPVILLSGDVAVSTPRHGEDGDLACTLTDLPDVPGTEAFIKAVDKLKPAAQDSPFRLTQSDSPWHPIILEWDVLLHPLSAGRKANPAIDGALDYEPTFITGSFNLRENEPDVTLSKSFSVLDRNNNYTGRCLMTPTASTQLETNLRTFLLKATLEDCRDRAANGETYLNRLIAWYQIKHNVKPPSDDAEKGRWLKLQKPFVDPDKKDENGNPLLLPVEGLCTWYGEKPVKAENNPAQDPIYSAISALSKLKGMHVLSQALGGFNAALMTRRRVLQLPIENPLEGELPQDLRALQLTSGVAQAVGKHHPAAPLPSLVFSPLRAGTLTLENLRLLDTFGQHWDAQLKGVPLVTSNGLRDPYQGPDITYLPPRLSPPARLNFRWLAALSGADGVDEVEMNSAPATTPVCGWLLPNNFDNSLMVYDNKGRALGSINSLAEWAPAPGSSERIAAVEIPNPHLRRLVGRLVVDVRMPDGQTKIRQHFLQSFLSTLDSAFETIEPANFAQHEALALLMGRPVAVVRARVDLQLMGQPTDLETVPDPTMPDGKALRLKKALRWKAFADQDWGVFAYDWGRYYECSYDDVMVPPYPCSFLDGPPDDYARTTHGFEKVVIPLRLGENQLLNDGLVGFWKETAGGELDNVFHAPQTLDDLKISKDVTYTEGRITPCIRAHVGGATDNLSLTLQDDPLALTMLVDPRGVVHATCGLLPVYQLEIPSAHYADALKRMGVTFRVSPLLTDAEQLHVALPKEAGYVWSWVTRPDGSHWEETGVIVDATEHAHFFKPPKIVEGWLKLTPKNDAEEEH
jgi:hypothetical protein